MSTNLILGGPGTGKTHTLMALVDNYLKQGVLPHRIAFVSFTKKAVQEAVERATEQFNLPKKAFPYFRTIHSLCFMRNGSTRGDVMGREQYAELGKLLSIRIEGRTEAEDRTLGKGDQMLFLDTYARSVMKPLKDIWFDHADNIDWFELLRFSDSYKRYRESKGLIDFTDMLTLYAESGTPVPVDVAIIDEAQDLTPVQWRVVERAFSDCKNIHIAGDDDQAIYAWSGADINHFLSLSHDSTTIIRESHRVPRAVFRTADKIASTIKHRYVKEYTPRDAEGSVAWCSSPEEADLTQGSWLLLARNVAFFDRLEAECHRQGVTYTIQGRTSVNADDIAAIRAYERIRQGGTATREEVNVIYHKMRIPKHQSKDGGFYLRDLFRQDPGIWHNVFEGIPIQRRQYYLSVLRAKRKLTAPPNVNIDTIHGVKGGQADSVMVLTDITARTEQNLLQNPDDEARVFYVGVTRAKENLLIVTPETFRSFPI